MSLFGRFRKALALMLGDHHPPLVFGEHEVVGTSTLTLVPYFFGPEVKTYPIDKLLEDKEFKILSFHVKLSVFEDRALTAN